MSCLDLTLLNTGILPTFERDTGSSIIDLTLVSPSLARVGNDWTVHDMLNTSDHRLISWSVLSTKAKKGPPFKRATFRGLNANKFDVELFQEAFNSEPIAAKSAQEEVEEAMRRVAFGCDATMQRKRPHNDHQPMYWWNNDIAKRRQETIRARRRATRARKNRTTEIIRNLTKQRELNWSNRSKAARQTAGKSWLKR